MSDTKKQAFVPKDLLIDSLKLSTEDLVGVDDFILELRELAKVDASIDDLLCQLSPETKDQMKKEAEELLALFPPVDVSEISKEEIERINNLAPNTTEDNPVNKDQVFLPKDLVIKCLQSVDGNSVGIDDFVAKLEDLARTRKTS